MRYPDDLSEGRKPVPHPPAELSDPALTHGAFEPHYRSLVENLRDPIYVVDLDGRLVFITYAGVRTLGYTPEQARAELLGRPFIHLMPEESAALATQHFVRGLRGEERSAYFEIDIYRRDETTIRLEIHASDCYDQHGNRVGRQGVARDMSELRQLQNRIAEKSARISLLEERARAADLVYRRIYELSMLTEEVGGAAGVPTEMPPSSSASGQLERMARGQLGIDDSDRQVLEGVIEGLTNREIAEQLNISPHTVKDRVQRLMQKFGVARRTTLAAMAVHHGLVDWEPSRG